MISTTEKRIATLENENKSRKSSYPVAASLVEFIAEKSAAYTIPGDANNPVVTRIMFTPTRITDARSFITLHAEVFSDSSFSQMRDYAFYINEIQSGNGAVIIRVTVEPNFNQSNFYIRVTATGTSEGAFTVL